MTTFERNVYTKNIANMKNALQSFIKCKACLSKFLVKKTTETFREQNLNNRKYCTENVSLTVWH